MVRESKSMTYSHGYGGREPNGYETTYIPECLCFVNEIYSRQPYFTNKPEAEEHEKSCHLLSCYICERDCTPFKSFQIEGKVICDFCRMSIYHNNPFDDIQRYFKTVLDKQIGIVLTEINRYLEEEVKFPDILVKTIEEMKEAEKK